MQRNPNVNPKNGVAYKKTCICNIAIDANDITIYSKYDQTSDLWQQLESASYLEPDLRKHFELGKEVAC